MTTVEELVVALAEAEITRDAALAESASLRTQMAAMAGDQARELAAARTEYNRTLTSLGIQAQKRLEMINEFRRRVTALVSRPDLTSRDKVVAALRDVLRETGAAQ